MALGPETATKAIGVEECLARLSEPERATLAGVVELPPNAGPPAIADALIDRLDDGRLRRFIGGVDSMVIRFLCDRGGEAADEWVAGHFKKTATDSLRRLRALGLLAVDGEKRIRLALEVLVAGRDWTAPAGSLLAALQQLPLLDLQILGTALGCDPIPRRVSAAAALYRRFCAGWPARIASLGEEERALLLALAAKGFAGAFAQGDDPLGRAAGSSIQAEGTWAQIVRDGPDSPLRALSVHALIIPGALQGANKATFWIPTEARGQVAAWRRERIREGRSGTEREPGKVAIVLGETSVLEFFKRLIIECMTDRIRVTQQNSINSRDWTRLQTIFSKERAGMAACAIDAMFRLGFAHVVREPGMREYAVRPRPAADTFLALHGEDRDRFVWARLEEERSLWPRRANERRWPASSAGSGEPVASPADVLRFLREDRFFSNEEIHEAFDCGAPLHYERSPLQELLDLLAYLGWAEGGPGGGEWCYRRTRRGSEIAAVDPRPVTVPPPPDRPLLVQPNGRIIADPATPLEKIATLSMLGDVVSFDPAFCFQLTPEKLRRAAGLRTPDVGARAFLERYASHPLPNTVIRLLDDAERSVVSFDFTRPHIVIAAHSPEDAARILRSKTLRGHVGGVFGQIIFVDWEPDTSRMMDGLRQEGFLPEGFPPSAFCRRRQEEAGVAPPVPDGEFGAALARAIESGETVQIVYRPPGRVGPEPKAMRAIVERFAGKRVFVRDSMGKSHVLQLGRIVRVSPNGGGKIS